MPTVTVRNLDDEVTEGLKALGHAHGRSMEAEIREILREAVVRSSARIGLGSRINAAFSGLDWQIDLERSAESPRFATFDE